MSHHINLMPGEGNQLHAQAPSQSQSAPPQRQDEGVVVGGGGLRPFRQSAEEDPRRQGRQGSTAEALTSSSRSGDSACTGPAAGPAAGAGGERPSERTVATPPPRLLLCPPFLLHLQLHPPAWSGGSHGPPDAPQCRDAPPHPRRCVTD